MMVKIMRSGLTSRTKLLFQSTGRDNFCQNEQELIVENLPKARFQLGQVVAWKCE